MSGLLKLPRKQMERGTQDQMEKGEAKVNVILKCKTKERTKIRKTPISIGTIHSMLA